MRTSLIFLALAYVSFILESTSCIFCGLYFLRIDPMPALVCWLSLNAEFWPGFLTVVLAGLMASVFSSLNFFLFPLSYLTGFLTVYFIRANMLEVTSLQAYLITGFISVEILVIQLAGSGNPELLWPWGIIQAGLDFCMAPAVFWICSRTDSAISAVSSRLTNEKGT